MRFFLYILSKEEARIKVLIRAFIAGKFSLINNELSRRRNEAYGGDNAITEMVSDDRSGHGTDRSAVTGKCETVGLLVRSDLRRDEGGYRDQYLVYCRIKISIQLPFHDHIININVVVPETHTSRVILQLPVVPFEILLDDPLGNKPGSSIAVEVAR